MIGCLLSSGRRKHDEEGEPAGSIDTSLDPVSACWEGSLIAVGITQRDKLLRRNIPKCDNL